MHSKRRSSSMNRMVLFILIAFVFFSVILIYSSLFLSVLFILPSAYAQGTQTGTVSPPTNSIPTGTSPATGPNGQIAFTSDRDGTLEIYVMNADGSSQTRLTFTTNATNAEPAWSPDGTKIAFTSDRDGVLQMYVMNAADGSAQTRLTLNPNAFDFEPAWGTNTSPPTAAIGNATNATATTTVIPPSCPTGYIFDPSLAGCVPSQ